MVPQVEISLIMPSLTPGKESSGGDVESMIPDSASLGDDLHSAHWPQTQSSLDLIRNSNVFNSVDTPSPVNETANSNFTSNPNTHGHNVQILTPISQTNQKISDGKDSQQMTTSFTGIFPGNKTKMVEAQHLTKELNSGFVSMKKGFSSFMTSIDSKFKTSMEDMSDTISIHSDYSSDSENFIMVMGDDKAVDCMDIMFKLNPFSNDVKVAPIEQGMEMCEDEDSSPSEPSEASSLRRRDLVSMTTFR